MPATLLLWSRGLHFGSGMILVGVMAFRWLVLLPAFADASEEAWQKFAPLQRKLHAMLLGSALLLVISGFLLFWAVTAGMNGSSLTDSLTIDALGTVLFQTQFGTFFQWRIGLAAALAVLICRLEWTRWHSYRQRTFTEIAAAVVAVALTGSFALTGHAAASGGVPFWLRVTADTTHLLVTAIWPAGLIPFALFLGCANQADPAEMTSPKRIAIRRFSQASFVAVWILIASGIVNAFSIVGSFNALCSSEYGHVLCLKLGLFLAMLSIAAWNRYRLVPLLLSPAQRPEGSATTLPLLRLRRFVVVEIALALAIIAVVSVLGTTPPPQ